MARIKIEAAEPFNGDIHVPVRITDMNYGNHLANDRLVTLLHEARVQWLAESGLTEFDFSGVSLIQGGLAVEYKSEVFYPDTLRFEMKIGDHSRSSFEVLYKVSNSEGKLVAMAKVDIICFDYQSRKVMPIPDGAIEKLGV